MSRYAPNKIVLSDEQRAWLFAHYDNTSNNEIAHHLGVSFRTVIRMARSFGLKRSKAGLRQILCRTQQSLVPIKRMRGTLPKKGVMPEGFKKGILYQFKHGHTDTQWHRFTEEERREYRKRMSENRLALLKSERRRVLFGFEQKTRLRVVKQSKRKIQYRYWLRKNGYVESAGNHNLYYITPDTNRSLGREEGARELGITFEVSA